MNLEKFTKIYIVAGYVFLSIAVVGIIFGFGYKAGCRRDSDSTEGFNGSTKPFKAFKKRVTYTKTQYS